MRSIYKISESQHQNSDMIYNFCKHALRVISTLCNTSGFAP